MVEFAVVAPLLFLLIFGMIEFGRVLMVGQLLTNAAREGARRGILEHADAAEVETAVSEYLTSCSIPGATVEVTPDPLSQVGFGDPVAVRVSVQYSQVNLLPAPAFFGGTTLTGQSVMRGERLE